MTTPTKRTPRRRARPSLAAKQKAALERERLRLQAAADRAAERDKQLADAKAAIQTLIDDEAARRLAALNAHRPATVTELIRTHNLPEDIPWHPRYNIVGVQPDTDIQMLEWICFIKDWPAVYGGLGAFEHLKNLIKYTWPDIEFNEWLEMSLRSLCDTDNAIRIGDCTMRFVNWVGSGSAGKTFASGLFAVAWYIGDLVMGRSPRSSVTLTSTSKGIIAQRVWPVIQKLFHEAKRHPDNTKLVWGRMIDSMKMVEPLPDPSDPKRRDSKHVINALAVEPGELQRSLDRIKGRHTERMMLIVDEANSTPQAIFECIPNMLTSARELIVLVIGNAGSRLDTHGLCCEPKAGWKSITVESTHWETKGVAKWGIAPGVCVHFDAAKSPNVLAGRTLHKHIYSYERWQQVLRMGDEYRNTLQHWSQDRGFWPPDGLQTTVFSEALVISHDGMGKFNWIDTPKPCAGLDPAFGGDDCRLQYGFLGHVIGNRMALQLTDSVLVPFTPDSPDSLDYQIALYVIAKCKELGVTPALFGLDATGIGRGVAAIIQQLWSRDIQLVEFGGAASDLPASTEDPRHSHEIYANRVTELWYAARDLLSADQLKGLPQQAVTEFCARTYEFSGKRYKVESKKDMKARLGYSPDSADAVVVVCDVARRNGLIASPYQRRALRTAVASSDHMLDQLAEGSYSDGAAFSTYAEVEY